ncbi:MAG: substrate-binding domain-containing protein [Candidatus Obscuribacter sp.]|nr:substrate-binding domain-containing protein [Candidatus Obscuribacter sp.]
MIKRLLSAALVVVAAFTLSACKPDDDKAQSSAQQNQGNVIRLLSGSENKSIEPILQDAARQAGAQLQVTYKGSVDIMLELEKGKSTDFDAVMPADRMWITLGDKTRMVKNIASIYRSPVVFGVKKSVAENLGWTKKDVYVADILKVLKANKLRFMMTSASQVQQRRGGLLRLPQRFCWRAWKSSNPRTSTSRKWLRRSRPCSVQSTVARVAQAGSRTSSSTATTTSTPWSTTSRSSSRPTSCCNSRVASSSMRSTRSMVWPLPTRPWATSTRVTRPRKRRSPRCRKCCSHRQCRSSCSTAAVAPVSASTPPAPAPLSSTRLSASISIAS